MTRGIGRLSSGAYMAICSSCKQDLEVSNFTARPDRPKTVHSMCRSCLNAHRRKLRAKRTPEEKIKTAINHYQRLYGISFELASSLANNRVGSCECCSGIFPLEVDHCHTTNKVRGLLCHHCNILLGAAKDNIETLNKAISYLRKPHEL